MGAVKETVQQAEPAKEYSEEVAELMLLYPGLSEGVVPPGATVQEAAALMLEHVSSEMRHLERMHRMRVHQAQELAIEKVLRGNFKLVAEVEDLMRMLELPLEGEILLPVLVQMRDGSNMFFSSDNDFRDKGQVPLIVSSIFSELLSARGTCHSARVDDKYAFLFSPSPSEEERSVNDEVVAICHEAISFIRGNFGLELRTLVGEEVRGLQNVHLSFRQILDLSDSFHSPDTEDGVISAVTMPKQEEMVPLHQDTMLERQYLNAAVTFDFDTACSLTMDRLQSLNLRYKGDLERLRPFIGARLNTTSNILAVRFEDLVDAGGVTAAALFSDAFISESYEEICRCIRRIFQLLDNHFNAVRTDVSGTAGKVISFVYRNFSDPDLSVENICDSLGKSRSYMSRMFKENTGMNLLDFLHTTRLTEAKRLLTETDEGISDIARQVGYYSGWTLARVFKRYEGITPTAYRKAYKDGG